MNINKDLDELFLSSKDAFNSNNFVLLLTNIDESTKLLQSFETFINKYFISINTYYKQLTEINSNFLEEEDIYKSSIINTPIFQLGKVMKKAIQAQIDIIFSIITKKEFYFSFVEALSDLLKILKESPIKLGINSSNKNGPSAHIQPVLISLMETFSVIETKIIDEYISKKYNMHILGIKELPLKDNIENARFLESTFLKFEEDIKKNLLNDLQDMERKTTTIFNEMKNIIKNIVNLLKESNITYLEQLENDIDLIGKPKISSKSLNSSYISIQNNEPEIKIDDENNLDMFQYSIKIIHNPSIQVIEKNDFKEKNQIDNREINEKINNQQIDNNDKTNKKEQRDIFKIEDSNEKIKNIKVKSDKKIGKYSDFTLTEEDIYNIVSTLYNYDFKMINKTNYDLNIEKEKLKVSNLAKKLLTFDGEKNLNEIINDEEVNKLYELLKDRETLLQFFIMLNNYRATGRYEATKRSFDIIKNIFNKAQDFLLNNRDIILEGLILILSETYYIKENGKKLYLQKEIKTHPLFKKEDFWNNYLIETIDEEIEKIKNYEKNSNYIISKEKHQQNINEIILTKLIPFNSYLNDFDFKEELIMNIINNIFDKYNVDENGKETILSLLENKNNISFSK